MDRDVLHQRQVQRELRDDAASEAEHHDLTAPSNASKPLREPVAADGIEQNIHAVKRFQSIAAAVQGPRDGSLKPRVIVPPPRAYPATVGGVQERRVDAVVRSRVAQRVHLANSVGRRDDDASQRLGDLHRREADAPRGAQDEHSGALRDPRVSREG